MGMIHSVVCSLAFCAERFMAWIACAFLIVILSIALIILFVYGVSVGYYYARKEIMLYLMFSATMHPRNYIQVRRGGADSPGVGPFARGAPPGLEGAMGEPAEKPEGSNGTELTTDMFQAFDNTTDKFELADGSGDGNLKVSIAEAEPSDVTPGVSTQMPRALFYPRPWAALVDDFIAEATGVMA